MPRRWGVAGSLYKCGQICLLGALLLCKLGISMHCRPDTDMALKHHAQGWCLGEV